MTAVVLLWDDWGGWYDPAPPAQINYTSLGFRVPMVVISPFAQANTVVPTQYQFGSILKFVEDNFGLGSLHTTDASSTSMADIFNFNQKPIPYKANRCRKKAIAADWPARSRSSSTTAEFRSSTERA